MTDFDARRALLQCAESPLDTWPLAAVLLALRTSLLTPPWMVLDPEQRSSELRRHVLALEKLGLDADSIVRLGLGDRLIRAVAAGVVTSAARLK